MLRLLENRNSNRTLGEISGLVTDGGRVGRGTWGKALVLSLDEAVRDSQHRVDDDGIDALRNLVLKEIS